MYRTLKALASWCPWCGQIAWSAVELVFSLSLGVGSGVMAEGQRLEPRASLRIGQTYTWAERMQLLQLGGARKAEAIPYPGLWDGVSSQSALVFKGRRWDCAARDLTGRCEAVRLLGPASP